jgi:phosphoserine phosphatase
VTARHETEGGGARYASVVLDVDSTLCGVEGIDWLAELRGAGVAARVVELTERAMRGEIPLDAVYGERLALVAPSRDDVAALADVYLAALAPGAEAAVSRLLAAGVRVVLVSGGLRQAILPVAHHLGIADDDVCAVDVYSDTGGAYAGFDVGSPLATAAGKLAVARALRLPAPALAVGDGATDVAIRPAVDTFAAFTGFVRREPVAAAADLTLASFDQLVELVLE